MANSTLSQDDVALGRAILLTTDSLGMQAEGAFWLRDPEDQEWRFFLITSLFNTIGPREIYRRLNEALPKKLSEREAQQIHVYTGAPTETLARTIKAVIATGPYASEPRPVEIRLDRGIARALVYRMAPASDERAVSRARRQFYAISKRMTEAA
jgi:hypothetical protein